MRLRGVGRRYGLRGAWVLRGVDLEVRPGSLIRVTGSNGSGKSTLLRLLAVEENYQRTVNVTGEHLTPVDDPEEVSPAELGTTVLEDIVDEIIETTLDRGGEVAFVPDDSLAAHERMAAVLRF
jgi:ABC-type cobalamin/Fe3+-siderophores transport system ATPase subunit